jgi:hypothetical protein
MILPPICSDAAGKNYEEKFYEALRSLFWRFISAPRRTIARVLPPVTAFLNYRISL